MARSVIVIGAGPMGLEAALACVERGFEVNVLESGEPGAALHRWGPTRFFTPLGMNISQRVRHVLGSTLPGDEALLTGPEMADLVLVPLANSAPLRGRVKSRHRVAAIGRRGLTRTDFAGHPMRAERPFRLLVDTPSGEQTFDADIVLDATGGYVHALPFGPGGLPARGASAAAPNMIRSLGELAIRRGDLRGKRILVVGHGHSAANAINALVDAGDDVRITWAVRTANRRPCQEVACDPLPERQRVVDRANELAESPPRFLSVERRAMIDEIVRDNGHLRVSLTSGRMLEVDAIAAFTGFRPDDAHIKELVVETSSVTEGGARLYRAISNITDCLSVPRLNRHDLESGEPDFYFVGARGYGRARSFLLQSGLAQIETIVEGLRK